METTNTTPRNLTESGLDLALVDEGIAAWEAAGYPPPVIDEVLRAVQRQFMQDRQNGWRRPVEV